MSKEDLYINLKKLVKQVNQRILRIEKLTGLKDSFAAYDLFEYLDIYNKSYKTKTGRISLNKNYTEDDLIKLNKAIEKFLSNKEASTISGIKQMKIKYEQDIKEVLGTEKKLSYEMVNTLYKSGKHYSWIYEYIPKSEFWGYWVPACNGYNWSSSKWIDELSDRIGKIPDEELKTDLLALYYYIKD